MKTSYFLTCICLLLAGCASTLQRVGVPEDHIGRVAHLKCDRTRTLFVSSFEGKPFCAITSLDGSPPGNEYELLPGKHSINLWLTNMGVVYEGSFEFKIDSIANYELSAQRQGQLFEIYVNRVPDGEIVAKGIVKATRNVPLYIPLLHPK